MKSLKKYQKMFLFTMIGGVVLLQAMDAHAGWALWKPSQRRSYDHSRATTMVLPRAHSRVKVAGLTYYYHKGIFYRPGPSGYVIVRAPLGAVVPDLPPACKTVRINGKTFYSHDNIFYQKKVRGYQVVTPPVVISRLGGHGSLSPSITGIVTVYVPNRYGRYTPVLLRRTTHGYIGPQGEWYPHHPSMSQLAMLYAL